MMDSKAWYHSKKVIAFFVVCLLLFASLIIKAPEAVTVRLAEAIMLGLPTLIGFQGYADAKARLQNGEGK